MTSGPESVDEARMLMALIENEAGITKDKAGNPQVKSQWFLVSRKWFRGWRLYNGLEDRTDGDEEQRMPGPVSNQDILRDPDTYYQTGFDISHDRILNPGLISDEDYLIFSPAAWDFVAKRYGVAKGSIVPRNSIVQSNSRTIIELELRELDLAVITGDFRVISPKPIFVSRKDSLKSLYTRVFNVLKSLPLLPSLSFDCVSLWEFDSQSTFSDLEARVLSRETAFVIFPGGKVACSDESVESAGLDGKSVIVAAIQSASGHWPFANTFFSLHCSTCRKKTFDFTYRCDCKKVRFTQMLYCSEECKDSDKPIHICIKPSSPGSADTQVSSAAFSRKREVGLTNLGNTCFMNAALQCLVHTEELTVIFTTEEYKRDLNYENKIGTRCKLVKAYAELVRQMKAGYASVTPRDFKKELGDFVPQFYGFQQQDSHELLTYVLDLLHEDLNRIQHKPTPQEVSQTALSEPEIAQRFWESHLSRNQSFIVDLMHGQYRSEIVCPKCGNVSLSFDPFVTLSVPLAPKQEYTLKSVKFIPYTPGKEIIRLKLLFPRSPTFLDIKSTAETLLGISVDRLLLVRVFNFSVVEMTENLKVADSSANYLLYELPEGSDKTDCVFLTFSKEPESLYQNKAAFAFPRLLQLNHAWSLSEVHARVYEYLSAALHLTSTDERMDTFDGDKSFQDIYRLSLIAKRIPRNSFDLAVTPCFFCDRSECKNCPLSSSTELPWKSVSARNTLPSRIQFELLFSSLTGINTSPLKTETDHESVARISEEERANADRTLSLDDCLQFSSQGEKLDSENEVYCSRCKEHVQATKRMSVYRLPKILIIHLKRFKTHRVSREKDDRMVLFPVSGLDMGKYNQVSGFEAVYDLYAVTNHYGGLGGGHYKAFAKSGLDAQWYEFDDTTVREISSSPNILVTSKAYVLFYRARAV